MSPSHRPPRLLLIEDSEDDAFFFRWMLQKSGVGAELIHLADGRAALDWLNGMLAGGNARPDIVFLDLKLPSFSGFEILEWINRQSGLAPLHVVILSGSEHAGDLSRAEALGATGYLVKPISVEQLKAQLARTPVTSP